MEKIWKKIFKGFKEFKVFKWIKTKMLKRVIKKVSAK